MNTKLLLKILVLVFIFLLVFMFRQYLESGGFKEGLNAFFGPTKNPNKINWCVANTVDFLWTQSDIPNDLKQKNLSYLRSNFCELDTEAISGIDIDSVEWSPLAESRGPTGQLSKIEWNKSLGVFRAGGMPFKSSKFANELQAAK
jgi:hypothetical protein